jgi:hypothetical protein
MTGENAPQPADPVALSDQDAWEQAELAGMSIVARRIHRELIAAMASRDTGESLLGAVSVTPAV